MIMFISNFLKGHKIGRELKDGRRGSVVIWFRTEHIVVLMAKSYYSKRTQSKSSKRNRHTG